MDIAQSNLNVLGIKITILISLSLTDNQKSSYIIYVY